MESKGENNEYKKLKHTYNEEELDLLSNYMISDTKLNSIINQSKNIGVNDIKPRRITRFIRLIKEIIKVNLFFVKEFFRIILKRY